MAVITRLIFAICAAALASTTPAAAALLITIDKAAQRMIVAKDDQPLHDWPVSTGLRGYDTPAGIYQPFRMEKDHFSQEWDEAPMPHSIFFTQEGHAIHGSFQVKKLGQPASHGCVRISPQNAATLWKLVREAKMANVRIVLTGTIPGGPGEKVPPRGVDPYSDDGWARGPVRRGTREAADAYFDRREFRASRGEPRYYFYERRSGFSDIFGR